jgi:hypothetical protein
MLKKIFLFFFRILTFSKCGIHINCGIIPQLLVKWGLYQLKKIIVIQVERPAFGLPINAEKCDIPR